MTKSLKPLLLTLSVAIFAMGAATANEIKKVATIDMQRLFNEYHLTKGAQEKIKINGATVQKENQEKLEELGKLAAEIKKIAKQIEDPVTSANNKKQLLQQHKMLANKGQALENNRRDWASRRETALKESIANATGKLMKEIQAQVDTYARENNIDMVLDKSARGASGNPFISFAKDDLDGTDEILAILNKDAPKATEEAKETPKVEEKAPATPEAPKEDPK